MVRESLSEEVTFKLKPDWQESAAKNILGKQNCRCKGLAGWRKRKKSAMV